MHKPIVAKIIVEMVGKPQEHIEATMKQFIKEVKERPNVTLHQAETAPAQEHQGLFSVFTEFELEFAKEHAFLDFCFDAMPSSIDILEPGDVAFRSEQLSSFMNDILSKMHGISRNYTAMKSQAQHIDANAMQVLQNFLMYVIHSGKTRLSAISQPTGMDQKAVEAFLAQMERKELIKKKGDHYALAHAGTQTTH